MKISSKTFFLSALAIMFVAPALVSAYNLSVPFPGGSQSISGPAQYINTIYNFGLGFGALLAIAMIVVGAIQYTVSEAIATKEDATDRIKNALWGLVLLAGAFVILGIVNPEIPKLKEPTIAPLPPVPQGFSCSLIATPSSGLAPLKGLLSRTVSNPDAKCNVNGVYTEGSGGTPYGPISANTKFQLYCNYLDETTDDILECTDSADVTVGTTKPLSCDAMNAVPGSGGGSVSGVISWTTSGGTPAVKCASSFFGSSSFGGTGSQPFSVKTSTTINMSCTDSAGGSCSMSTFVNVTP